MQTALQTETADLPRYGYLPVGTGVAILLLPAGVAFWLVISGLRVFACALPWIVLWSTGFLVCGGAAVLGNLLFGGKAATEICWMWGGGVGVLLMSVLHGLTTATSFWRSRHQLNSPLARANPSAVGAQQLDTDQGLFVGSLSGTVAAGLLPATMLVLGLQSRFTAFPPVLLFAMVGGVALALEGLFLGLSLGARFPRSELDLTTRTLGETLGHAIAGPEAGVIGSLGWGIGYAFHQAPLGVLAGACLGLLVELVG